MPLGRAGTGIESYSALNNPTTSPISNYYCRGYSNMNDIHGRTFLKKNKVKVKQQLQGKLPARNLLIENSKSKILIGRNELINDSKVLNKELKMSRNGDGNSKE